MHAGAPSGLQRPSWARFWGDWQGLHAPMHAVDRNSESWRGMRVEGGVRCLLGDDDMYQNKGSSDGRGARRAGLAALQELNTAHDLQP